MQRPSRRSSVRSTFHRTTTRRIFCSGVLYLRGGRVGDAIDALKISIWSNDSVAARLALADAFERAGLIDEARSELQNVLSRDASNVEARQRLDRLAGR